MKQIFNKNFINKYYNPQSSIKVLSALCKNPRLLEDKNYNLTEDDFVTKTHKVLFVCIYNLYYQGATSINVGDIESYLSLSSSIYYKLFFDEANSQNLEWLQIVCEEEIDSNLEYYYQIVRKFTLLRSYLKAGFDIRFIYDIDEIDMVLLKQQQRRFETMSCADMIREIDDRIYGARCAFENVNDDFRYSGDEVEDLLGYLEESPIYGMSLESKYLSTLTGGNVAGSYFVETRSTGQGKSRWMLKRLVLMCSPYIWDFKNKCYIENPNNPEGRNIGTYLQTELDNYMEVEPIILSCISGINTSKIKKKQKDLTEEEKERLKKAMEYSKQMKLMIHKEANYDTDYIATIVEKDYKRAKEMGREYVCFALDYINLTPALGSEYNKKVGLAVREDMVLLYLSSFLKDNIANPYQISVLASTQTNAEGLQGARNEQCIKGGKAIPSKATAGWTCFAPTKKELKLIEPILKKKQQGWVKNITPNIVYTVYKMREGEYANGETKIFGYQDLGTMNFIDLLVCNVDYEELPHVPFLDITIKK